MRGGAAEVGVFTRRACWNDTERIKRGVRAEVVALDVQHAERRVAHLWQGCRWRRGKRTIGTVHYDGNRRYEEELTLYPPSPPTADATSVQKAVRCGQSARRMREFVLKYTTYTASYLKTELASGGKGERGGGAAAGTK